MRRRFAGTAWLYKWNPNLFHFTSWQRTHFPSSHSPLKAILHFQPSTDSMLTHTYIYIYNISSKSGNCNHLCCSVLWSSLLTMSHSCGHKSRCAIQHLSNPKQFKHLNLMFCRQHCGDNPFEKGVGVLCVSANVSTVASRYHRSHAGAHPGEVFLAVECKFCDAE